MTDREDLRRVLGGPTENRRARASAARSNATATEEKQFAEDGRIILVTVSEGKTRYAVVQQTKDGAERILPDFRIEIDADLHTGVQELKRWVNQTLQHFPHARVDADFQTILRERRLEIRSDMPGVHPTTVEEVVA